MTVAPAWMKALAVSNPIPEFAPVTIAILPSRSRVNLLFWLLAVVLASIPKTEKSAPQGLTPWLDITWSGDGQSDRNR